MPTPGRYTHGPWELTKSHWSEPWQARHAGTGQVLDTGQHHVERAKEVLPVEPVAEVEQAATAHRFTLAVNRSTASPRGHRRAPVAEAEEIAEV